MQKAEGELLHRAPAWLQQPLAGMDLFRFLRFILYHDGGAGSAAPGRERRGASAAAQADILNS